LLVIFAEGGRGGGGGGRELHIKETARAKINGNIEIFMAQMEMEIQGAVQAFVSLRTGNFL
jgi:hypothetical protein